AFFPSWSVHYLDKWHHVLVQAGGQNSLRTGRLFHMHGNLDKGLWILSLHHLALERRPRRLSLEQFGLLGSVPHHYLFPHMLDSLANKIHNVYNSLIHRSLFFL